MTLKEAIELLTGIGSDIDVGEADDDIEALKLGIEALKAIPHYRRIVYPDQRFLLPGETKE